MPLLLMSYLNPLLAFGLDRLPVRRDSGLAVYHPLTCHTRRVRRCRGTRQPRTRARADGHARDAAKKSD